MPLAWSHCLGEPDIDLVFRHAGFRIGVAVKEIETDHLQTRSCIVGRELGTGRSGPITRTRIEEVGTTNGLPAKVWRLTDFPCTSGKESACGTFQEKPADAPESLSYTRLASSQHSRRSAFRQLQPVMARWLHEPPDDARSSDIGCNLAEVPSVQVNQQLAEDVIDGVARCGCFGFDG